MKTVLIVIGVLLIAAGIYVVAGQASYKSNKDVLDIGGLKASVQESHPVPVWAGAIGIVAGAGLMVAGARSRT